jgi:hypothetical protein
MNAIVGDPMPADSKASTKSAAKRACADQPDTTASLIIVPAMVPHYSDVRLVTYKSLEHILIHL